jgi:hypothetical protein
MTAIVVPHGVAFAKTFKVKSNSISLGRICLRLPPSLPPLVPGNCAHPERVFTLPTHAEIADPDVEISVACPSIRAFVVAEHHARPALGILRVDVIVVESCIIYNMIDARMRVALWIPPRSKKINPNFPNAVLLYGRHIFLVFVPRVEVFIQNS